MRDAITARDFEALAQLAADPVTLAGWRSEGSTHTPIEGASLPVIETHISNVHAREPFRQHSYLSSVAAGVLLGFGVAGYPLALRGLHALVTRSADEPG